MTVFSASKTFGDICLDFGWTLVSALVFPCPRPGPVRRSTAVARLFGGLGGCLWWGVL